MRKITKAEARWGSPLPQLAGGDGTAVADPPENDQRTLLQRLIDRRAELSAEVEPLIEAREKEHVEFEARIAHEDETQRPTEEERNEFNTAETRFNADLKDRQRELHSLDLRIERQELVERGRDLSARAARPAGLAIELREPEVYGRDRDRNGPSYYLDYAARMRPDLREKLSSKVDGFEERLHKHGEQQAELLQRRQGERKRLAERQIELAERESRSRWGMVQRALEGDVFETRAPSREPGQGGYAIPPLWLIDEYLEFLRPGRVAAGLARQMALPAGTDSINIPKLTTPTVVGIQTADNAPVVSQDIKDNFVNAAVKTIAGFADIPVQLLEQSPGMIIDRIITRDMMAAYDVEVDKQLIAGKGLGAPLSGGEIKGLYPSTNWEANTRTWTSGSPTANGFFQLCGAMASKTALSRFNLQDFAFLAHPSRWFWAATQPDKNERPMVEQADFGPYNVNALIQGDQTPFEGLAGRLPFGPNVYIDANVPITDTGHETTGKGDGDVLFGAIWDDIWLFEGDVRMDVFDQTLSGTLEIRFRLYNYVTALQRYGPSVTIATGTGFAPAVTVDGVPYR